MARNAHTELQQNQPYGKMQHYTPTDPHKYEQVVLQFSAPIYVSSQITPHAPTPAVLTRINSTESMAVEQQ